MSASEAGSAASASEMDFIDFAVLAAVTIAFLYFVINKFAGNNAANKVSCAETRPRVIKRSARREG